MAGGGDAAPLGSRGGSSSSSSSTVTKRIPLNVKSALIFPIGKTSRLLQEANYAPKFDATVPVYLASVLEYLSAEVLELSGNAAKDNKSKRIECQHLDMAVKNDDEFIKMLENMKSPNSLGHCGGEENDDSLDFYNGDVDDHISIPSDDDELDMGDDVDYDDDEEEDNEEEPDEQPTVHQEESAAVTIGQMSIAAGRVELYKLLVDQFGEIVVPNLSKFKVEHTCLALNGLLNLVASIIEITPKEVSEELVSDWEDMASFYSGIGLRIDWFFDRIHRYRNWLVKSKTGVDITPVARMLVAKGIQLEAKRKEVSSLEREFQTLSTKIERAKLSWTQFDFSFFDE